MDNNVKMNSMNTNTKRKPGRPPKKEDAMKKETDIKASGEQTYTLAEAIQLIQQGKAKAMVDDAELIMRPREKDSCINISIFDRSNVYQGDTFKFTVKPIKNWRVYEY